MCFAARFGPDFAPADTRPRRLPDAVYDATHVRLELEIDIPKKKLWGWCRTTLTLLADRASALEFDAVDMKIGEVLVEDRKTRFDYDGKILKVRLPRPAEAGRAMTVSIRYALENPGAGIRFVAPDKARPNRPLQAWTQGQTDDARCWFPCHDVPGEKATSEMIVTVPAGMTAVSNGALLSCRENGRTRTFHYKMGTPHSMYLFDLAVGWFEEVRDDLEGLPIQYFVYEGKSNEARRGFGKTPAVIRFFNEATGTPYPYEKYAQIAAHEFGGGMENTSATIQTDAALMDERAALDTDFDGLVAHELAHQWFGDLVTCREWSDAWLNESFATYYELLFQERDKGIDEFRYKIWTYANNYFDEDSNRYRRPIATKTWRESFQLFDRHLYPKGACVLHYLRSLVGDAAWRRAIKHYLQKHRFGAVETRDLIDAIREATGANLEGQFDQWIFRGGHPEFRVAYSWSGGKARLYVAQKQAIGNPKSLFELPVDFRFITRGGPVDRTETLKEAEHLFEVALDSEPVNVLFDPESKLLLKKVEFLKPPAMWHAQLEDSNVVQRVEAVQNLAAAANVGRLEKAFARETHWGAQAEIARALGRIRTDAARETLARMLKTRHPKARRAVVESLGEFRNPRHAPQFLSMVKSDPSYLVSGAALVALAKTGAPQAKKLIGEAMKTDSWEEMTRRFAATATAELEATADAMLPLARPGQPEMVRSVAIEALGRLGKGDPRVTRALVEMLKESTRFVPGAAANALAQLGDPAAHTALKEAAAEARNSALRGTFDRAARVVRLGQTSDPPSAAANGSPGKQTARAQQSR